ncbi:MAG: sugar ABC transporter substrate-binding protein [Armatimonadetes bacterium]|nr:sugar ABC transporter substrate-binding protein [Armatimonadota bacterium]
MKWVFAGAFVLLCLLAIPAYRGSHDPVTAGKTRIVWISDDNPVRKGQIELFNKTHPSIELKIDPTNAGMEKVIVQSLAGVGPDLFDCYNPFQLSAYVRAGIAADITDDMLKAGVDVGKIIWPAVKVTCVRDERAYGFPCNAACDAVWFNKKLFEEARIPYPDHQMTWDELIALAKRLTVREADGRAKQFGLLCDWWQWQSFIAMWGGSIFSADGSQCVVDSPEAIAAVQFLHDLIYVHKVMPSPADEASATQGGWGSGTISFFSGDKGAMAFGGRWWLCTLRMSKDLRSGVMPAPFGPGGVYRGYGRSTLVSANSKNRAAALEFMKYLAGPDYNQLLNDQGDALAPVPAYCQGERFLHNPEYPQETDNQVWADAMAKGVPDQVSPYVNGNLANRILTKQLDLVKNDQKTAADALRSAAKRINEEIAKGRAMAAAAGVAGRAGTAEKTGGRP